ERGREKENRRCKKRGVVGRKKRGEDSGGEGRKEGEEVVSKGVGERKHKKEKHTDFKWKLVVGEGGEREDLAEEGGRKKKRYETREKQGVEVERERRRRKVALGEETR
ncbi:hypothetical protein KUCAC02_010957, partial [Chaenocephalus aceratus]